MDDRDPRDEILDKFQVHTRDAEGTSGEGEVSNAASKSGAGDSQDEQARGREHMARRADAFPDLYEVNYLKRLREDWPE